MLLSLDSSGQYLGSAVLEQPASKSTGAALDQPAFNRKRLKAEKLIDSKALEQLIRVHLDADKLL